MRCALGQDVRLARIEGTDGFLVAVTLEQSSVAAWRYTQFTSIQQFYLTDVIAYVSIYLIVLVRVRDVSDNQNLNLADCCSTCTCTKCDCGDVVACELRCCETECTANSEHCVLARTDFTLQFTLFMKSFGGLQLCL